MREVLDVSERRACRVLGQHRSMQRKVPCEADDEQLLTKGIIDLARQYTLLVRPANYRRSHLHTVVPIAAASAHAWAVEA